MKYYIRLNLDLCLFTFVVVTPGATLELLRWSFSTSVFCFVAMFFGSHVLVTGGTGEDTIY